MERSLHSQAGEIQEDQTSWSPEGTDKISVNLLLRQLHKPSSLTYAGELSFGEEAVPAEDLYQTSRKPEAPAYFLPSLNLTDVEVELSTSPYERINHDQMPLQLCWKDLCYSRDNKEFIQGVSGCADFGQLLAIMGSSGAGKTTLLNILSGRLRSSKEVTGNVEVNGQSIAKFDYQSYVGYVTQDDILLDTLTPRECLTFAANLRLKGTLESKKKRVEMMLQELKLSNVADNKNGSTLKRGLSGGERRRVAIAVELIVDPGILFLDGTS